MTPPVLCQEPLAEASICSEITDRLGPDGIGLLKQNLWPQDCQSCGEHLGGGRPSLVVTDFPGTHEASLHHQDCRRSEWNSSRIIYDTEGTATHAAWWVEINIDQGLMLPIMVVNPTLERVCFEQHDGAWRVTPDRRFGFAPAHQDYWHHPDHQASVTLRVYAEEDRFRTDVILGDTVAWSVPTGSSTAEGIRNCWGCVVFRTHRVNPPVWAATTPDYEWLKACSDTEAVLALLDGIGQR